MTDAVSDGGDNGEQKKKKTDKNSDLVGKKMSNGFSAASKRL